MRWKFMCIAKVGQKQDRANALYVKVIGALRWQLILTEIFLHDYFNVSFYKMQPN